MNLIEKAPRYLDRMPPAVSGQSGHDQTFRVACVLCQGFGLSADEARPLMHEYSIRCVPPWSEREIEHKLLDAARTEDPKGRGYLLKSSERRPEQPTPQVTPAAVPARSSAERTSSVLS
jgi:hypothetical protein